jgi:hypothetical protein
VKRGTLCVVLYDSLATCPDKGNMDSFDDWEQHMIVRHDSVVVIVREGNGYIAVLTDDGAVCRIWERVLQVA